MSDYDVSDYDGEGCDHCNEAVDSCDICSVNIYADEYDGTHVCPQCQWYAMVASGEIQP